MAVFIDWRQASAPDELARQIVNTLSDGALAALPSEAGTVLVADTARLADPDRPTGLPERLALHRLDGYFDAADFFARVPPSPAERAMASRLWPGPVGWVDGELPHPAWVPSHMAVATVLAARRMGLALFEINGGRPIDLAELGDSVATIVTDGTVRDGPVTVIRPNDGRWSLERPGIMSAADIRRSLARKIVFVCTGNTCRSPMAEGLFKQRLAERLGCALAELPDRGFVVSSAGIAASNGFPATRESIVVLRDLGVDIALHRSQPASADMIGESDDVIAMTRGHLATLLGRVPVVGGSLRLLCGSDGDLDDPIGGGPDVYHACATTIRDHVDRLITEMGLT